MAKLKILSNDELTGIEQRVRALEDIAIRYIRLIFTKLAGESYFENVALPSFILPATQAVAGPTSEYTGPTEMAEYYANIEILSNSTVKITFQ